MATATTTRTVLDELARTEGKAELIGGKVVHLVASGELPSAVAFIIAVSLRAYAQAMGVGMAFPDGTGYTVPILTSGRQSFSPDASYYAGPRPANRMRFISGAPTFAAEVRSECDYLAGAELDMAAKRADYFEAGTLVVWDVDPLAQTVTVYRATDPAQPVIYRRGDAAEAEPAVPGWRMPVDDVFAV